MSCDCIERLPAQIKEHCNKLAKYAANPVLDASFKDLVFPVDIARGSLSMALKTDVQLKLQGRKTPKKTTMTFTYCPFCGQKYKED